MSQDRMDGANGTAQPITSRDIAAWSELTGTPVRPDEVAILRAMDLAYRRAMSAEIADSQKRQMAETKTKK